MVSPVAFMGASSGEWHVLSMTAVRGEALQPVDAIAVTETAARDVRWTLRGVASHVRYATRPEVSLLASRQQALGRESSRCAALIPIRKSQDWWRLAQDERRAIFEEQSRHGAIGFRFLPAIARQLYHARDLGEPFDFLTWFEFARADVDVFEELLARLRETEEWRYVEAESDIRLVRT